MKLLLGAIAGGLLQFEIMAGSEKQPAAEVALFKTLIGGLVDSARTSPEA